MKNFAAVRALVAIGFLILAGQAGAQSNPGLTKGPVLTAGQWNALFAGKQDTLGYTPLNIAGGTMSGKLITSTPSSLAAGLNLPHGAAPGAPVNGDLWTTTSGLYARISGATVGPFVSAASVSLAVGVSTITGGTDGRVLYDNAGVLGELATTGSGSVVRANAPTLLNPVLSGTVSGAGTIPNAVLANSAVTIGSTNVALGATAATISGLTLASPVFSGTVSGAGTIPNTVLVNSATTVNGVSCALGSTCSPPVIIGTTPISGGTTARILYDNAGAVGELATTGSGNVVLATSPTIASPTFSGTVAGAGTIPNSVLANSSVTIGSTNVALGASATTIAGLTLTTPILSTSANITSTAAGAVTATLQLNSINTSSGETHVAKYTASDSGAGVIRSLFQVPGTLNAGIADQARFDMLVENGTINMMRVTSAGALDATAGAQLSLYDRAASGTAKVVLSAASGGGNVLTTASSNGLSVGRLGSTTPAFNVDASTASSITGITVKSAATTGGVDLTATGETNVAMRINAAGSGTLTLNGTATGDIATPRNYTVTTAASTLILKRGANGSVGTFVCTSGGTIPVSNSNIAITDAIIISLNTVGGTISTAPSVSVITAASGFSAKCATSDTSTYNYSLVKNAA